MVLLIVQLNPTEIFNISNPNTGTISTEKFPIRLLEQLNL
jgi:hypothetical protein